MPLNHDTEQLMPRFSRYMLQAWPVLLEAIRQGRTVSYTELAARSGRPLHHRHIHRQLLIEMSVRCRKNGLPDLAALVVRKDTGKPGSGWHDIQNSGISRSEDVDETWEEALTKCLSYAWRDRDIDRLIS